MPNLLKQVEGVASVRFSALLNFSREIHREASFRISRVGGREQLLYFNPRIFLAITNRCISLDPSPIVINRASR